MAEFSIDFRVKAAASGWNECALKSAFFKALNENIKDELATIYEPTSLEDLIRLSIRLDNRLRIRDKARQKNHGMSASTPASNRSSVSVRSPGSSTRPGIKNQSPPASAQVSHFFSPSTEGAECEPMQIGHTRLSPEERQRRFKGNLCLYCGEPGHFIASCPAKSKAGVRQRM